MTLVPDAPPPSWGEIAAMMNAMAPKSATADAAMPKWIVTLLAPLAVVLLGGLGTYAGSTIAGVGTIGIKIDGLKSSLDDLKKTVDAMTQQSNQQQIAIGKQDLRITSLEQNQARLMDRMRAVEGGPRIVSPAPGSPPAP